MRRRPDATNVLAVLAALWLGATCSSSCTHAQPAPTPRPAEDTTLVFLGIEPFVPDAYVRGVWSVTQHCLQNWDVSPDDIRWGVADAIVDMAGKQLLWGVVAMVGWSQGRTPSIVVDKQVRRSARVLSHEAVHVIADVPDGDWRLDACLIYDGPYILPPRPLTDEQIAALTNHQRPANDG